MVFGNHGNGKGNQKSFVCRKHNLNIWGKENIDWHMRKFHGLTINEDGDFVPIGENDTKPKIKKEKKIDSFIIENGNKVREKNIIPKDEIQPKIEMDDVDDTKPPWTLAEMENNGTEDQQSSFQPNVKTEAAFPSFDLDLGM